MGHLTLAGKLTEEEKFGAKLGRLDVPQGDGSFCTQYFGGQSVYRISIVSEEVARHCARSSGYAPVCAWDFPRPALEHRQGVCDDDECDEEEDDPASRPYSTVEEQDEAARAAGVTF